MARNKNVDRYWRLGNVELGKQIENKISAFINNQILEGVRSYLKRIEVNFGVEDNGKLYARPRCLDKPHEYCLGTDEMNEELYKTRMSIWIDDIDWKYQAKAKKALAKTLRKIYEYEDEAGEAELDKAVPELSRQRLITAVERADRLLRAMEYQIKNTALDADWFREYNEHCNYISLLGGNGEPNR